MSVSGISSNILNDYSSTQDTESTMQQMKQEFQQLGQDLQSGNLSAAQQDFATFQSLAPQNTAASPAQSDNPIAQPFNQLSQDLQSGNLTAARQDYTQIQQDLQSRAEQTHGHHHHHGEGGSGENEIGQLFDQLGQALQSGYLSTAQQVFNTLQQDFQQSGQNNGLSQTSPSGSTSLSVSA